MEKHFLEETVFVSARQTYSNQVRLHPLIEGTDEEKRAEERRLAMDIEAGVFAGSIITVALADDWAAAADEVYRTAYEASLEYYGAVEKVGKADVEDYALGRAKLLRESVETKAERALWDPEYLADLQEVEAAGMAAKRRMLEANLRWAMKLAHQYEGSELPIEDLYSAANHGLIRAVEKFDYTKGFKFSNYSKNWILQFLGRTVADESATIYLPTHKAQDKSRLNRKISKLESEAVAPTVEALAAEMDRPVEAVREMLEFPEVTVHLDNVVHHERSKGGEETKMSDLISDPSDTGPVGVAELSDMQQQVEALLASLEGVEALVLRLRFGLIDGKELSYRGISQRLKLRQADVRTIEARALEKLQDQASAQLTVYFT